MFGTYGWGKGRDRERVVGPARFGEDCGCREPNNGGKKAERERERDVVGRTRRRRRDRERENLGFQLFVLHQLF